MYDTYMPASRHGLGARHWTTRYWVVDTGSCVARRISGTNVITHISCSDDWLTQCSLADMHKGGLNTPIWWPEHTHLVVWTHPFGGLNTPIWWPEHTHLVAWTHPFGGLNTPIWWPEHTHLVAWTHPFGGLNTPIWWPQHTHLVAWTHPFVFIISIDLANYISHLIILCSDDVIVYFDLDFYGDDLIFKLTLLHKAVFI